VFQTLVKNQIQSIESRKFKYLVAHCAHCFNVFRNEYPQFGATFNVLHHTELISQLLKEGRLEFKVPIERTITYHDPCYLGRFNGIYEQPREILKAIKGITLVEMEHNRDKARCCGGGGGHYWMDINNGERLNVTRGEEAHATGAEIVTVGCIYCLHMMDDAIKILNLDDKMTVYDISELVIIAMGGEADARLACAIEEKLAA
jgi:Fe-S oxidoreductase